MQINMNKKTRWDFRTIIIPHHSSNTSERSRNLRLVLNHIKPFLQKYQWEVIVYEMGSHTGLRDFPWVSHITDSNRFVKAVAWNRAFKRVLDLTAMSLCGDDTYTHPDRHLVVLLDNDIVLHDSAEFFEAEDPLQGKKYVHPYTKIHDTDMVGVWDFEKYDGIPYEPSWNNARNGRRCYGGFSAMSLGDIVRIGGFCTEFKKWGHEDDIFHYSLLRHVRLENYTRFDRGIIHLNHPNNNTKDHLMSFEYLSQQVRLMELKRELLTNPMWTENRRSAEKFNRYFALL